MSFSRPQPVPRVPTPPQGDEVAAYPTYLEAQQAVDFLSDHKFPVQGVTIVGTDLKMVERVTGRLTYGRVAIAGAGSGAWFGLFVGLLLSLFGGGGVANGVVFIGIALGAGFGLLFSVLSYALTGGRRDFTSQSQIVATTYAILCASESSGEARSLLLQSPNGLGKSRSAAQGVPTAVPSPYGAPTAAAPAAPAAPAPTAAPNRAPDPRWTTPTGEPRYGAMRPTPGPAAPAQPTAPVQPTTPVQPAPPSPEPPAGPPTPPPSDRQSATPSADPYAPPQPRDPSQHP
ncbi:general stress protein [Xylanimonas sp. McL0601]|uniref:general stress protein n=1 Tax=Xylanimonas sp. McL0601 TaxID=3414739 RepID=UPI003CFACF72